uniref:Conjugation-specific protein n=1 Tax=Euplotes crassus TaxID=5936 RepID=Q9XY67_EUPCR|nr:conjugation-specific protein [Moneuplotes crassus]
MSLLNSLKIPHPSTSRNSRRRKNLLKISRFANFREKMPCYSNFKLYSDLTTVRSGSKKVVKFGTKDKHNKSHHSPLTRFPITHPKLGRTLTLKDLTENLGDQTDDLQCRRNLADKTTRDFSVNNYEFEDNPCIKLKATRNPKFLLSSTEETWDISEHLISDIDSSRIPSLMQFKSKTDRSLQEEGSQEPDTSKEVISLNTQLSTHKSSCSGQVIPAHCTYQSSCSRCSGILKRLSSLEQESNDLKTIINSLITQNL